MGKFDGILLCTDYDGTLAVLGGEVPKENCEAIEYFKSEGGLFTVASGRRPDFILGKCRKCLPNAPIVSINGGLITDSEGKETLSTSFIDPSVIAITDEIVTKTSFAGTLEIWPLEGEAIVWNGYMGVRPSQVFSNVKGPLLKVVSVHPSVESAIQMRDMCRKSFTGLFTFERSWETGLEILPSSGGKGCAVRKLKKLCGAKCMVTAGDFENDESLVSAADIGYAVGNAVADVKAAAHRVTVKNTEFAIRQIIRDIEADITFNMI